MPVSALIPCFPKLPFLGLKSLSSFKKKRGRNWSSQALQGVPGRHQASTEAGIRSGANIAFPLVCTLGRKG